MYYVFFALVCSCSPSELRPKVGAHDLNITCRNSTERLESSSLVGHNTRTRGQDTKAERDNTKRL